MNNKQLDAWLKLKEIAKELRGDWNPSWYNYGESKYYPIHRNSSNGFEFWYVYTADSHGGCSERFYDLVLQTKEQAEMFGRKNIELWKEFLLGY
jgi:hypothetical protein